MKRVNHASAWLGVILLVALALRLWGINFGLPYFYHPDEARYIISAQQLFKTHSLDPASLPDIASSSLVYVVNALAYVPYYVVGRLAGVFHSPGDVPYPQMLGMGVGYVSMPTVVLLGRLVTLLFGLGNVVLVYWIGRRLFPGAAVGLLAALMLALSPSNVTNSRYVTPDTFVVFFVLAAFLGGVYIWQRGGVPAYVLTGAALGCLASAKISGGLVLLPVLTAHYYRRRWHGFLDLNLVWLGLAGLAAFVLTTPYVFGNAADVLGDILTEGRHYAGGHPGMEGDSLAFYLANAWQTLGLLALFAVAEIGRGVITRSKEIMLLAIFPVASFVFISSFITRNDRTFLPLTPFLFLLAASFLVWLFARARSLHASPARVAATAAVALLGLVALLMPLPQTTAEAARLTAVDSRETARVWLEQSLPPGSSIAVESYAPYVDPARFKVEWIFKMIDHDPQWYVDHGFDYLVFSAGMFGRYYDDPQRYAQEVAAYDQLFARFPLVKQFTDGGYDVRVYQTR